MGTVEGGTGLEMEELEMHDLDWQYLLGESFLFIKKHLICYQMAEIKKNI